MHGRTEEFWEIAIAANAVVKGLLGYMGQSGHVCQRTIGLSGRLHPERGLESLLAECGDLIRQSDQVQSGDILVLPDKLFAIAQGRVGPREILLDPDPKKVDHATRQQLADAWASRLSIPVDALHLLLADEYVNPDGTRMATLGALDHNRCAAEVAQRVREAHSCEVDVIISDTDTGLDVREPLIGTLTLGATPLGATAGLNLYECMRCACAAEFARGHTREVPIVLCRPADRCRDRPHRGEFRGYSGSIHFSREGHLTYA